MSKGIIVLDPGHGQNANHSPAVDAYYEGNSMFTLSQYLRDALQAKDYTVLVTRSVITDNPSLSARGQLAGKNEALLFLSLHSNAVGDSGRNDDVTGVDVFYSLTDPDANLSFANGIGQAVANTMGNKFRGSHTREYPGQPTWDYYGVIRASAQSGCKKALLIEHGFHTSTQDTSWLLQDANLKKLAEVEAEYIANALGGTSGNTDVAVSTPSTGTLVVGSKVVISNGAIYGGLTKARGSAVPSSQLSPKEHTVSKIDTHNGVEECLLKEISSWVANKYLTVVGAQAVVAEEWYRVRKTWDDPSSQLGAFSVLDNAKKLADANAAAGYKVFNGEGSAIYIPQPTTSTEPEQPDPSVPAVTPVEEDTNGTIKGSSKATVAQAISFIKKQNPEFNEEIAKTFFDQEKIYGIKADVAIAQSILETGYFKYSGSSVKAEQNNYGGIGAVGGGAAGASFSSIEEGVKAEFQHLWAYCCKDALPSSETKVDPRFDLVNRGSAQYWLELGGKWAVPGYDTTKYDSIEKAKEAGASYGDHILSIRAKILLEVVSTDKTSKYFSDIPAGHWSIDAFDRAAELGIFNGTGDGKAGFTEELARSVQLALNVVDYVKKS